MTVYRYPERQARWYQDNADRLRSAAAWRRRLIRTVVLAWYGDSCACCGSTDRLEIDHIAGGGRRHRLDLWGHLGSSTKFYQWLIGHNFPAGFQVLCGRCNRSKRTGTYCRLIHGEA